MPIYEYKCEECEIEWEAVHRIDNRLSEKCTCGKPATLLISGSAKPVIYDYYSENLGAHVTGPAHRKKLMKARNLEEV